MKSTRVNKQGDHIRHLVTNVTGTALAPNVTHAARATLKVNPQGRIVYEWSIFQAGITRSRAKKAKVE